MCEKSLPPLVQYPIREMKFFTLITCIQIKQIYPPCIYFAPMKSSKTIFSPRLEKKMKLGVK